jgi:hypothetical protein
LESGLSSEDYIDLFDKLNVTSPSVFRPTKSRIGKYLKWLVSNGILEKSHMDALYIVGYSSIRADHVYDRRYFKDFQSLQDTIDNIVTAAEKLDDAVFSMQISLIYLAWSGVPLEDALRIKKTDVQDDCIMVGDRVIRPNSTIMEFIKDYRDADGYDAQGCYVIHLRYRPSEYLFRTSKSPCLATEKIARIAIRRFVKCADLSSVYGMEDTDADVVSYGKVYLSGIFNRAYLYELTNGELHAGDLETLKKVFCEDFPNVALANLRLKEYQNFRQYFFSTSK